MGRLKAGVGSAVVTPPVGAEMIGWMMRKGLSRGVHDHLMARCLVLEDGSTPIAIVALDAITIFRELTEHIGELVSTQTPIPRENILVNCSHTHASPSTLPGYHDAPLTAAHRAFLEVFPYYVAGAIIEAWHHREDASIGAGWTDVSGITVNRRDPSLPVDPHLGVIRVDDAQGWPLACLANYACHGTAVGPHDLEWTGDFAGYLARALEDAIPGCAGMFLQGAQGDIQPWDNYFGNEHPRFPDGYESAERLGKAIAGPAAGLFQQIETTPEATICIARRVLELPPRPIGWTAEDAEAFRAKVEAMTEPWAGEVVPDDCPACMSAQRYPATYRLFGARHEATFARHHPANIPGAISVVRINDIVLAANPGEMFSALALQLRAGSPYPHTFVLGLTNDTVGYIPTRDAAEAAVALPLEEFTDPVKHRRHYGATITTTLGPTAGEMIVAETLRIIRTL